MVTIYRNVLLQTKMIFSWLKKWLDWRVYLHFYICCFLPRCEFHVWWSLLWKGLLKVIVALQGIISLNCRVGSIFQGPSSYVFANFDVLGEWKVFLIDENWNGNMAIEIFSKQLRKETWNQLGRAVAESVDLIIGPPECLLYTKGSVLIAAFCLVSFWSEVNRTEARFHFCLFFRYQIWNHFLWWIYARCECIIMA